MTATTKWIAGTLAASWTPVFNTADLTNLATGAAVLGGLTFDNTAALDQFADFSFVGTIASSTIAAGAGVGLWLSILQGDGVTYGDGRLTAGTQLAGYNPQLNPIGGIPISAGTTQTAISGSSLSFTLPPQKFGVVAQNLVGFTFTGMLWMKTYRQNVNA